MGYVCCRCGNGFTIWQGEPGQDDDIDLCWACLDKLFREE